MNTYVYRVSTQKRGIWIGIGKTLSKRCDILLEKFEEVESGRNDNILQLSIDSRNYKLFPDPKNSVFNNTGL